MNAVRLRRYVCDSTCAFCERENDAAACVLACNDGRQLVPRDGGHACVARRPWAPTGLAISAVAQYSLTLAWEPSESGGEPLYGYAILVSACVPSTDDADGARDMLNFRFLNRICNVPGFVVAKRVL